MVAAPGNNYATKLKDPAARQRAYQAYCDWLAKGKTKKSFTYVEDDLMCIWATIENYIREAPQDFDPIKKELAYAAGCARWEQVVDDTADGKNKQASVPTLNMIMRNKYKWDTAEHEKDVESSKSDLSRFAQQRAKERDEWQSEQQKDHSESRKDSLPDSP